MKSSPRLLIVTYRFGSEFPAGAERHLWELARRLGPQEGISCEVWTTDARGLAPVAHWGAMLSPGFPPGVEAPEPGLTVRRFPLARWPRAAVALASKAIEWRWEREEREWDGARLLPYGGAAGREEEDLPTLLPGPGWHPPEFQADGSVLRWTHKRFLVLRKGESPAGRLELSGMAPRRAHVTLRRRLRGKNEKTADDRLLAKGWFHETFDLPPAPAEGDILEFQLDRGFHPLRDHRTLGLLISRLAWTPQPAAAPEETALESGFHALLRRRWEDLFSLYVERAKGRPEFWGRLFDWTRGPRCPSLFRALARRETRESFGAGLAANLPWGVIPAVARRCPLPMAALAIWHFDDEYYYWNHYIQALRKARVTLANNAHSAREIWPRLGVEARWAGPGVEEAWAERAPRHGREDWRRRLGLAPDAPVILTVSRKSMSKRYDLLLAALRKVRETIPEAALVFYGQDEDHRPVREPGAHFLGPADDLDLHDAFSNADVFAMMSESESFGMVFAEAWLRGLPVIGNRWCGAVASLIEEGRDGYLAGAAARLAEALSRLLQDPALRRSLGAAGREKTLRDHTWRASVGRVAGALRECVFPR